MKQIQTNATTLFSSALLVEDEAAHAKLLTRALSDSIDSIEVAGSAKEAIEKMQSTFFEIVFCDLNLPDVSGIEFLKQSKKIRPKLPVIVLTSSSSLDDAVGAMQAGAADFMQKQFSNDLSKRLRLLLERVSNQQEIQLRELELRAERDAFWLATHAARDGLAILGSKGEVIFSNEAYKDFTEVLTGDLSASAEDTTFLSIITKYDPGSADTLKAQLDSPSADRHWNSELKAQQKDDESQTKYYDLTLTSVQIGSIAEGALPAEMVEALRRHVVWVRDITRRKEIERFQRDILATTSHDLKGPLGAILTSAELLENSDWICDEKGVEMITRVGSCARNCITIIDELLSARKIQDGVFVIRPREHSVWEIIEDAALDFLPVAKSKSVSLSAEPIDPAVTVYADRIGLGRTLGNLVSNAVKFTPKGGQVRIFAEWIENETRISVRDTGPGINASARRSLFQRYNRMEEHHEVQGTGLGLYVVKNIVDAHGGRVEVDSTVGEGTVFTICLPHKEYSTVEVPTPKASW